MAQLKVCIINLARCQDRREQTLAALQQYVPQIELVFFQAVDAKAGEHLAFSSFFHKTLTLCYKGRELSAGEKACFASHYSLWRQCVALGEPILVLEDDLTFTQDFLEGVLDMGQRGYAYVRLAATHFKGKKYPLGGNYYLSFERNAGSQGYYITPEAAQKFLDRAGSWFCPLDDYLDLFYYHGVPAILRIPYLVGSAPDLPSTISPPTEQRPPRRLKLLRKLCKSFRFTCKTLYVLRHKKRLLQELAGK